MSERPFEYWTWHPSNFELWTELHKAEQKAIDARQRAARAAGYRAARQRGRTPRLVHLDRISEPSGAYPDFDQFAQAMFASGRFEHSRFHQFDRDPVIATRKLTDVILHHVFDLALERTDQFGQAELDRRVICQVISSLAAKLGAFLEHMAYNPGDHAFDEWSRQDWLRQGQPFPEALQEELRIPPLDDFERSLQVCPEYQAQLARAREAAERALTEMLGLKHVLSAALPRHYGNTDHWVNLFLFATACVWETCSGASPGKTGTGNFQKFSLVVWRMFEIPYLRTSELERTFSRKIEAGVHLSLPTLTSGPT